MHINVSVHLFIERRFWINAGSKAFFFLMESFFFLVSYILSATLLAIYWKLNISCIMILWLSLAKYHHNIKLPVSPHPLHNTANPQKWTLMWHHRSSLQQDSVSMVALPRSSPLLLLFPRLPLLFFCFRNPAFVWTLRYQWVSMGMLLLTVASGGSAATGRHKEVAIALIRAVWNPTAGSEGQPQF